jgi:hypothetical protein
MKIPNSLKRWKDKISEVSDERSTDEGIWIYLIPGWWSPEDETHCIHEDTLKECAAKLKGIEPCPCCPEDRK